MICSKRVSTTKKNEIISVKSTLGKKKISGKKQRAKKIGDNKVIKTDNIKKLKAAIIIIPIVIVLIIAALLFFVIQQVSSVSQKTDNENTQQHSAAVDVDSDKLLTVVSPSNPLPTNYKLNLVSYETIKIDEAAVESLNELISAAKQNNINLQLKSGYVSTEEQNELYNAEVKRLTEELGYSRTKAEEEAEKNVPMGNHADTQLGLSVEFDSSDTESFENSPEYQYLIKDAYKYGFILRYPEGKEDTTSLPFKPSLFRYVGKENALRMTTLNMCLDQYVIYLNSR